MRSHSMLHVPSTRERERERAEVKSEKRQRAREGGGLATQNVTRILLSPQNIKRILLPRFLCISQQYVTCDGEISFHNNQGTIARVPRTMKKDGSITSLNHHLQFGSGNSRLAFSYLIWNTKILDPQWNIEFRQRLHYIR